MSEFNNHDPETLVIEDSLSSQPSLNHFQRIIGIFSKPQETLEDINRNPKVLMPLLIIAVLTSAVSFLNFDFIMELQRQAMVNATMQQGGQVPLDGFTALSQKIAMFTVLGSGLGVAIGAIITSLITHGVSTFFGGEGSVKKVFSATLYIYFIPLLGSALAGLIGLALNIDILTFSPAVLLDATQVGKPLYSFLSTFDLFNLWKLGLMILAVKTIESITLKKASTVVIVLTLLGLALQIVPNLGK